MKKQHENIGVSLGDEQVTLHIRGSRHVRTARILGREVDPQGVERVWLDRVVLARHEFDQLKDGWSGTGAISTVLERWPRDPGPAAAA